MSTGRHDCQSFDAVLWRFIDRELSAREMADVSAVLRECETCRVVHDRRVREARVLRAVLADPAARFSGRNGASGRSGDSGRNGDSGESRRSGAAGNPGRAGSGRAGPRGDSSSDRVPLDRATERGVERFLARFEAEKLGSLYPSEDGFDLRDLGRSTRQRHWRFVTVLSMLVLIPALVGLGLLVNHHQSQRLGALSVEGVAREGDVTVEREGGGEREDGSASRTSSIRSGGVAAIDRGARYVVPEGSRLRLLLGGRVAGAGDGGRAATLLVFGPAELTIHKKATLESFRASLSYGMLEASVDPSFRRDLFEITSPHAFATVVGTVFQLRVDSEGTELEVTRGRVDFGRLGSSRQVETVTAESGTRWLAAAPNAHVAGTEVGTPSAGEPSREAARPPLAGDGDSAGLEDARPPARSGPDLDQPVGRADESRSPLIPDACAPDALTPRVSPDPARDSADD